MHFVLEIYNANDSDKFKVYIPHDLFFGALLLLKKAYFRENFAL